MLSLCVGLFIYLSIFEFSWIKPSHFTETKIYVKLDPKTGNTAHRWERYIEKTREYIKLIHALSQDLSHEACDRMCTPLYLFNRHPPPLYHVY